MTSTRLTTSATWPLLCLTLGLGAIATAAEGGDADRSAHAVQITTEQPRCAVLPGLPIIPNDPAVLVTSGGMRCHAAGTAALALWVPENRLVWLDTGDSQPKAWVMLGGEAGQTPDALGLRLLRNGAHYTLETRIGDQATLQSLTAGNWHALSGREGRKLWVMIESPR